MNSTDSFRVNQRLWSSRIVQVRLHHTEMQMKEKNNNWTMKWKNLVKPTRLPGVFQRKEGGTLIRARITDPTTGRLTEIKRVLPEANEEQAFQLLVEEKNRIKQGKAAAEPLKTRFCDYAVSLLERKIVTKEIKSARGRERWVYSLRHLISGTEGVAGFGDFYIDQLQTHHVEDWKMGISRLITEGKYAPTTANGWLHILRHILKRAKREQLIKRNPAKAVSCFDTSEHEIYTEEEPNALTSEETAAFLACMKEECPAQYAMTFLGIATGLRPSSMRPLRRKGPTPDVLWDQGVILIRRSHTLKDEFMKTTKTGLRQRITVPAEVMDILRWNVDTQLVTPEQQESDLLFPADNGGFRSECFLTKAFALVGKQMGLRKKFTPSGMRRTFNDLARLAKVEALVTKSISGHKTDRMKDHYSTVQPVEQRESIGRLLRLVRSESASGAPSGAPEPQVVLPSGERAANSA